MSESKPRILVINPGSTSTKLGWYEGPRAVETAKIDHAGQPWLSDTLPMQIERRTAYVKEFLAGRRPDMIMARGGLLKPLPSGVYRINRQMLEDLKNSPYQHASNLAAPMAWELARQYEVPAYIADPVTVDELQALARYAGHPAFERRSIFHALNHKATARRWAADHGKEYEQINLIVIHMGGGISVGAHRRGRVVDVNQALDGEGPMSPQRSGTLPSGDLVRASFSGKYTREELLKMITGRGGLLAYTGTDDVRRLEQELDDPARREALEAMIYQIAKYAGEMAVVLQGNVDAIILTGGLAHSDYITGRLKEYLSFLAPVAIYPGENELDALAYNGWLVWQGKLQPKEYV